MGILFNIPNLQPNLVSTESKVQFRQLGASNHTDSYRANQDYYATDPIAITKLLAVEIFSNDIWEPAVGGVI